MALQQQQQQQSQQDAMHSCEICGVCGLTDDEIRVHTRRYHVDGQGQCPFCGLSEVSEAELLVHVNQAHLDYLTPDNECMSFIDDRSPSIDDQDSDSLSGECRGGGNPSQPQTNGFCNTLLDHSLRNGTRNHVHNNLNDMETTKMDDMPSTATSVTITTTNSNGETHTGATPKRLNSQDSQERNGSGGHGSPMRSQLGLKLKTTAISSRPPKTPVKSPLECPLCSFKSDTSNVLEEHINRTHFDPLSPSVNNVNNNNNNNNQNGSVQDGSNKLTNATLGALQCPICVRIFPTISDLELHVNIEHKDILSPANFAPSPMMANSSNGGGGGGDSEQPTNVCPMCECSFENMRLPEMEQHIETHFGKSPQSIKTNGVLAQDMDKEAKRLQEKQDYEMLRAQYGMDNQGNFKEQSSAAMQRAVYSGQMSVADYYERQVGLRAAESHGIDDGTSCTKSVAPRIVQFSANATGVVKSLICSGVDHYASNYGDKGWGCGYRNMQMLLSSLLQNTTYNEAIYSAWGNHAPSRTAMPSISRLQLMVEAAWNQGFDVQGAEQLGCKLHNTRKWIGATEIVTVLSWLRINCELVDFHKPTSGGGHPELFNYVLRYFEEPKAHTPPLYLQHQGHSRTIIGIEQKANGLTLLILDPSHGPRQVAALGSNQESLRLIRRGPAAMRAPQYQIVAVKGLIETKEEYQASKVLRSLRIPPDR